MSWAPQTGVSLLVGEQEQATCDCSGYSRSTMSLGACRMVALTMRVAVICLLRSGTHTCFDLLYVDVLGPQADESRRVSQRRQDTCDCATCGRSMSPVACRTMTVTRRIVVICLLRPETEKKNRTHGLVRSVVNICFLSPAGRYT